MKRNILITIIVAAIFINFHPLTAQGGSAPFKEYDIKAAFVYNFIKFVEWPENLVNTSGKILIAILGRDPFEGKLDKLIAGKSVKNRKLTVDRYSDIRQIQFCHVLFISNSEKRDLRSIFAAIGNKNFLTIGESSNFLKRGGIIKFLEYDNKIRFEINLQKAHASQLKISSRLLRLADNLKAAVAALSPKRDFFSDTAIIDLLNQFEPF